MIAFKFNVRNMIIERHDIYLERTSRGAIVFIEDDIKRYLPKDCINDYTPFSFMGKYMVVFDEEYDIDRIHNGFIHSIIRTKEKLIQFEIENSSFRIQEINKKIDYFRNNLK